MADVCLIDLVHYPGSMQPSEYDPRVAIDTYEERLQEYELAERIGFDGLFLTEHHFTAYNLTPSPNVLLAAIAQRVKRMRLGVMANIVPFHQPVRLAEECAMLDLLTDGRLEIGLGRGIDEPEFIRLRASYEEARPRFQEGLELMVKAWSQETFFHKGQFFDVGEATLYPRPIQRPHPKIWVTANSPASVEWAASQGYAMSSLLLPPEQTKAIFDLYRRVAGEAGNATGGDQFALARHTVVADTTEEAKRIARNGFEAFVRLFKEAAMPEDLDALPDDYAAWREYLKPVAGLMEGVDEMSFDMLCEGGLVIAGDPDSVREQLIGQIEDLGCRHFLAVMRFGYITGEETRRSMELFAEHVLPAVHELG